MKGQISITAIITGLGTIGAMLGLFGYSIIANNNTNGQVQGIIKDISLKGERLSALEEAIFTIKEDNKTIKADLKELLKRIK